MTIFRALVYAVFSFLIFIPAAAHAAPQILGLVATASPVPLTCKDGICSVEVSAFCMQSHRFAPNPGTEYTVAADTVLKLIYQDANGLRRQAEVQNLVAVHSSRGYSSIKISLPEDTVRQFSSGSASLQVSRLSSVVPKPVAHEKYPLSAHEIALYTGPFRAQAETVTEGHDFEMMIVRGLNRLINGLPDDRRAAAGDAKKLWAKSMGDAPAEISSRGLKYIAKELRFCETISIDKDHPGGVGNGFRSCLESAHDDILQDKTEEVWNLLKAGG